MRSTGVLAAKLQPLVDDGTIPGAVMLVASKDEILDFAAIGWSDLAAKRPMAADAFFWIASMAKSMTGAAFMMLVDEGKVSLDDPVEKFLPGFKGQKVVLKDDPAPRPANHPILIREILSHSSGLPFRSEAEAGTLDRLPLAEAVDTYATTPLMWQPGTDYAYSNAGINTAGRIIEVLSGMSYEKFMDERLFHPLGMKDTTFWPNAEQLQRQAKAYQPQPNPLRLEEVKIEQLTYPLDKKAGRYPMPAGGLFSTAPDVARFCQMCLNDGTFEGRRYLSPKAVRSFSHGGAFQTYMGVDPAAGIISVFLIQIQGPWLTSAGENVFPTFVQATRNFGKTPASAAAPISTEGQSRPR
jgi:CubicO group peptidase (beta-lactamase class C family)